MKPDGTLARRLTRAIAIQAGLITLAAVLGVYLATVMLENVLIKQALQQEADYFWSNRDKDPHFSLPNTANLTGYLVADEAQALPPQLRNLSTGFHQLSSEKEVSVAYVSNHDGQRLLLLFDASQVGELATYFGVVPLAGVLVLLYLTLWVAYRILHRMFSPVIWLARKVNDLDPQNPDVSAFKLENLPNEADQEVRVLATAISAFADRLDAFVTRERNFTRDASHELRSPLTVIQIAAEMLMSEQELDSKAKTSVLRIQRAVQDMEELTEAFLILARESEQGLSHESVCINDVVKEELEQAELLFHEKSPDIRTKADCRLITRGSDKVLSVVIGNLIRNAIHYTDAGVITLHIQNDQLTITDSGVGIPKQQVEQVFRPFFRSESAQRSGYGVGLTIVKRLSDRFNWPVEIDSTENVGTRVIVKFPDSECESFSS